MPNLAGHPGHLNPKIAMPPSPPLPSHLDYQGRQVALKYHKFLSGRGQYSPNSLSALRETVAGRVRVIEFDIGLLRDNGFALLHDSRVERETTGIGPLKNLTREEIGSLRLRDSDEPPALLREVVAVLAEVDYPLKVQIDYKEFLPIRRKEAKALLAKIKPLRNNPNIQVVVGCLADWNLRVLRRLDPDLELGLDFAYHLDAPVDGFVRLPIRANAYGYLDDHPLGYYKFLSPKEYLQDRLETLLALVPNVREFYVRKDFLKQALKNRFNPVAFIHQYVPGSLVDIWTIDFENHDSQEEMHMALAAGADQVTSNTPLQWVEAMKR